MAVIKPLDALYSPTASKKFGIRKGGIPGPNACIYRTRKFNGVRIIEKMDYYTPTNPQTIPQQANRGIFADAVLAWQNLTATQKEVYNKRAVGKQMSGYNLFIREYMLSH